MEPLNISLDLAGMPIADPYEAARLNNVLAFPDRIRHQILVLASILLIVNLVFMLWHEPISEYIVNNVPVAETWPYDIIYGVNLAFAGMIFYTAFRS